MSLLTHFRGPADFYECKTNTLLIWRKWNIILHLIIVYKNLTDRFLKSAQHACLFVCNCEGVQAQAGFLHFQTTSSNQGRDLGIQEEKLQLLEWWCHVKAAWSRSTSMQPELGDARILAGEGAGTLLCAFLELGLNANSAPASFPAFPMETGQICSFSWG